MLLDRRSRDLGGRRAGSMGPDGSEGGVPPSLPGVPGVPGRESCKG